MKLAISNIAWSADEEPEIATLLQQRGIHAVEIAPTKVFDDPLITTLTQRNEYIQFWADHDISIVAFQSLLFGRPELQIFGDEQSRETMFQVLAGMCELAGQLGASRLVFGSPKNRLKPDNLSPAEAGDIAASFFTRVASVAQDNGAIFCIEPNPPVYGCNYVTTSTAGLELVTQVNHHGFGLHLDAAGMALAGEDIGEAIRIVGPAISHFHGSAPELGPLEETVVNHHAAAEALRDIGYSDFVSIEMKRSEDGSVMDNVDAAIQLVKSAYF